MTPAEFFMLPVGTCLSWTDHDLTGTICEAGDSVRIRWDDDGGDMVISRDTDELDELLQSFELLPTPIVVTT